MRRYVAELIGTFVLVFGGVGTAVLAGSKVGYLGIALAFGLTLLTMAYAIGPISGCHINPAVTVGFLVVGRIGGRDAVGYIFGQVIGGIIAAAALFAIAHGAHNGFSAADTGFGTNGFGGHSPGGYNLLSVAVLELILTALLIFVVLGCTDKLATVEFAGIPIGLTLTLIHLISIPVDNTSVNPARSIGPALFTGGTALTQLWAFIVFPLLGAVLGALAYRSMFTGAAGVPVSASAVATESSVATEASLAERTTGRRQRRRRGRR